MLNRICVENYNYFESFNLKYGQTKIHLLQYTRKKKEKGREQILKKKKLNSRSSPNLLRHWISSVDYDSHWRGGLLDGSLILETWIVGL